MMNVWVGWLGLEGVLGWVGPVPRPDGLDFGVGFTAVSIDCYLKCCASIIGHIVSLRHW